MISYACQSAPGNGKITVVTMTSKERVLTAVARRQPDRVPMDFSANPFVLKRLHDELGTATHRQLLDRLHSDIVDIRGVVDPVYRGPIPKERMLDNGVKENFWGWRQQVVQTAMGPEEVFVDFVLAGAQTLEDLRAHRWPEPDWFDFTGFGERLDEYGDLAVMASGASIWQHPSFLRGLENLLADLLDAPEMAEFLLDKFTDFYVAFFDRMFTAAQGRIDLLRIADDLGTQQGLLLGPEMFSRVFAPRLKRLIDLAHSHGVRVMFHSCGSIVPYIEPLIALGVDVLDSIQVTAAGMDPQMLEDRFGARLCLHGSIDTQRLLPRGTPAEVADTVRQMCRVLGAGGGFILAPCHVLQTDVPTANVLALYDTGFECGCY
jgi:uroporphyrinogen decarboxylase